MESRPSNGIENGQVSASSVDSFHCTRPLALAILLAALCVLPVWQQNPKAVIPTPSIDWLPGLGNDAERLIVAFLQGPPMRGLYSKGGRCAFSEVDLDGDPRKPEHQGTRRSWAIF